MLFLFGRRRSQSDAAPLNETQKPSLQRRISSGRHIDDHSEKGIRGLFRRHSGSLPPLNIPAHDEVHQKKETPPTTKPAGDQRQAGKDATKNSPRSSSRGESPTAGEHCEPKQPGNIQDLLEYRLDMASKPRDSSSGNTSKTSDDCTLTKSEVKAMLSGAPHFLLERGKHKRYYPQVIFPWDEQNSVVQHMWDRKPLPHASFTLSTLHAHLPVPDDWAVKGGVPIQVNDWRRTGATNRATFDIGIFEVPNMLSNNGKEPGTVGFRHFLELPVSDAVRFTGPEEPKRPEYMRQLSTMGATEAFELMEGYNKPYSQCQSGAVFDRHRLISEGPEAWKRIGVRDINLRSLVQRLEHLRQFREEMLRAGSTKTILDIESPRQLHESLHTRFLHPHPPPADILAGYPESIKSQIKTLAVVLATPGAWINFSLPEWRFRAGQVLWEVSQHGDGDCLTPSSAKTGSSEDLVKSGMERKWLLIQLLLSAELLLRLDAFVRVDMLHDPHGGNITVQELRHFEKLREGKVNWDLVVVRRFLNSLDISCPSPPSPKPSTPKSPDKSHRFAFLEAITRRSSFPVGDLQSAWDCQLSSSHVRQQLEGLYVFAENIGWPRIAELKTAMELKLGDSATPVLPPLVVDDRWGLENTSKDPLLARADMYTRDPCRRRVKLNGSSHTQPKSLGWISRTWLFGFVIPGEGISHLLMATILENDAEVLDQLGTTASLYGGFTLDQRSWWSKSCVVGRVLSSSSGARTCMGWIGSDIVPSHATTLEKIENSWFELAVEDVQGCSSKPRIKQGAKLALESSPLGTADITAAAFTLPRDPESIPTARVALESLTLSPNDQQKPSEKSVLFANEASMSFSIASPGKEPVTVPFPLKYNVRFVSAHQCCPPLGVKRTDDQNESHASTRPKYTRLTGHPLHQSYPYQYVALETLSTTSAPPTSQATETFPEIMVIDARGDRDRETFARAWCASVGCHAIIGRSGRTCVACCIRQARAVEVRVVVRISD
ncbi:unnamed protein product [Penicillium salamii]|uniref:Uncharacterized protein n=1 Tax=Penicillium salamii TaxID=1612424 RepID=A0A9W4JCE0_9EURO|nr:unnamed protein product [Penicillium salamii]